MSDYLKHKNEKFLRYWEGKRQNKRRFYIQNTLFWGLLGGTLIQLIDIDFKLADFELIRYLLYLIFWSLGGLLWSHIQFKGQEKHYHKLKAAEDD